MRNAGTDFVRGFIGHGVPAQIENELHNEQHDKPRNDQRYEQLNNIEPSLVELWREERTNLTGDATTVEHQETKVLGVPVSKLLPVLGGYAAFVFLAGAAIVWHGLRENPAAAAGGEPAKPATDTLFAVEVSSPPVLRLLSVGAPPPPPPLRVGVSAPPPNQKGPTCPCRWPQAMLNTTSVSSARAGFLAGFAYYELSRLSEANGTKSGVGTDRWGR